MGGKPRAGYWKTYERKGGGTGHVTPRRSVTSEHWPALDSLAASLGTTATREVSELISEVLTDTTAAIARCKRIRKELGK